MAWETYEISLFDHNDNYISTLIQSGKYYDRQAYTPMLSMTRLGEITLTFTIPIVIYNKQTKQWEDNTLWYNKLREEGNLAVEKKVKVIFDKNKKINGEYVHRIVETVITGITETRDGRQLYCNVTATGLAFKWLGKIGYTITLDSDTVLLEEEDKDITIEPTINYWLDKIFPRNTEGVWLTPWRYDIQMSYDYGSKREKFKVYEDDDIVSWTEVEEGLEPIYNKEPIEKKRFLSVEGSNKYNITQDIAELFETYVRYEFLYEDTTNPFKVTGGVVVFYNNDIQATEYAITYGDNETGLSRTIDSTDMTTKMYVPAIESEYSDNGYISIADADNNITKDTFILNFDYYEQAGFLSNKQINGITQYKRDIRKLNTSIDKALAQINVLEDKIIDAEVEVATYKDKIQAAQESINDYTDKLSAIDSSLTTNKFTDEKIAYLVKADDNGQKYITLKRAGVIADSLVCNTDGATFIIRQQDDYGFVSSLNIEGIEVNKIVYFTYDYDLLSYYRNEVESFTSIRDACQRKLDDKNSFLGDKSDKIGAENGTLYQQLNYWNQVYEQLKEEKENTNIAFENLMGYFLKEGQWDTSDYKAPTENKKIEDASLYYDDNAIDGEQLSYYLSGKEETKVYYNYILWQGTVGDMPEGNIEKLVITEKWTETSGAELMKQYQYNAQWTPAFMKINGAPKLILLFNTTITFSSGRKLIYKNNSGTEVDITSWFIDGNIDKRNLCYRRYKIDDSNVITNSITISKDSKELEEFYDYFIDVIDAKRYITFKCNGKVPYTYNGFTVAYKCDRTTAQFYYDARDVSDNSAFPTTSYEVSFSYLQKTLNKTPYIEIDTQYQSISKKLNNEIDLWLGYVVRINDHQMRFSGVRGIVSEISLDLEQPQNNTFKIQNYKTSFQDLFGRIVASSEQMNSRGDSYERAANAVAPTQEIVGSILQNTINNNQLIFNSGYTSGVTFDDFGITVENNYPYPNGVKGQVIIRGGGIFISNSIDADGNRLFSTGLTPNGINASVITAGRIDTEKVNIYSGDQIRFTWKADGLFAYSQFDNGMTNFDRFVRMNEDGLLYEDNGFKSVELGWNGLYIGAQDGSVELTAKNGLVMYDDDVTNPNRVARFKLGRFEQTTNNYSYGLRLYNANAQETLVTRDDGELWLQRELTVGQSNTQVGLSGLPASGQGESPIRFWAGASSDKKYKAPFWVREDGSFRATNAYIAGEIHATSGEFTGTIIANNGYIGGWKISDNALSSGNMTLSSVQGDNPERVNVNDKFVVLDDGTMKATGADISGTITATGGKIGNMTIEQVEDMAGDLNTLTIKIESSNGNMYNQTDTFTTTFTATGYKGNVPFTDEEYATYTIIWESSTNGVDWTTLQESANRFYSFEQQLTEKLMIRCRFAS